jgi:hypothetical protein
MTDETEPEFVLVIRDLTREQLKVLMPLTKEFGDRRLILDLQEWDDFEAELEKADEK